MNVYRLVPWCRACVGIAIFLLLGLFITHRVQAQMEDLTPATAEFADAGPITGIKAVAVGFSRACALTTGGGVKCWGDNGSGQLGDGTKTDRLTPTDVTGLTSGVKMVVSGYDHTCALTTGGGVKCWGGNDYGQLGDGTKDPRLTPTDVSGLTSGVQMISAGGYHTCAVTTNGGLKCWGNNFYGQLGDSTKDERLTPVNVSGLTSGVQMVSAGDRHTCAVTTGGGVKCWGNNEHGRLGDGTVAERLTAVDVTGLTSGVQMVSAANAHTCVLTTGGGVKCWGVNGRGQVGDGTTTERQTAVDVTGLTSGVQAVTADGNHTCALTSGGGVKCWGLNSDGQIGDNTVTDRLMPVNVTGLISGVQGVSAGLRNTCAVTTAGGVKCWGANSEGQLGNGTRNARPTPVNVSGLTSDVQMVSAGGEHTCALTTAGGVKCWGQNANGRLGDDTTNDRWIPLDVSGLTSGVQMVAAGYDHTCALTTGGGVKCWGNNENGRLGDGTVAERHTPVDVTGLTSGVQMVSAGVNHTCALTTGGGVKCWGANFSGQLGDGTKDERLTPVDVTGLTNGVQMVSAGEYHTCALTTGGGVKCWGWNGFGQIGDGTNSERLTPVNVTGLTSGVQAISAGRHHTCALTTGGGVKCWGSNSQGRLGDGTLSPHLSPVTVIGLASGVQAIAAGGSHTCALTTGGGFKCWGNNDRGQLGDGTFDVHYTPVNVTGGLTSGVQGVSAGGYHTCALTTSGGLRCWGDNSDGELGINPGWTPMNVIDPNAAPAQAAQITSSPITTAKTGQPYTYAVTATGVPTPVFSLVNGPAGMTIDPTSGLIQWTPTQAGSFQVTVKAENGVQQPAQQSFTIVVSQPTLYLPLINK